MAESQKAHAIGINHVALEVGNIDHLQKTEEAIAELTEKNMAPE